MKHEYLISGLTPMQNTIMDHFDNGRSIEQIADQLAQPRRTVQRVVQTYAEGSERRDMEADAARGSALLLVAIRNYSPAMAAA